MPPTSMNSHYLQVNVPTSNLGWRSSVVGQNQNVQLSRQNSKRCSIGSMDPEVAAYLNASSLATHKARGPYTERKRPRGVAHRTSKDRLEFQGTVAGHRRDSKASYRISFTPYPPVILETPQPPRPMSPSRPLPPTPSHYRTTSISSDTSFSSSQSSSSSSRFEKSLPPPPPPTSFKTHSRTGSSSSHTSGPRRTDIDISTPAQTPLPPPPRRRVPQSTTPTPASRLSVHPNGQQPSLMNGIKTVWKRATTRVRHMPLPGKLKGRRQQRDSVVWDGFDRVVQYDVVSRPRHAEQVGRAVRHSKRYSGLYHHHVPANRDSMGTTRSSRIGLAM